MATVADLAEDIEARIHLPVQTNEVGWSAVLVGGYVEVAPQWAAAADVLELGASAGLNLRWDRYWYDTGASTFGDPASPVRFAGMWCGPLPRSTTCRSRWRRGPGATDRPSTSRPRRGACGRSYVWPDQLDRHARLDAALAVAAEVPAGRQADLGAG